jgi:hypothetical protein
MDSLDTRERVVRIETRVENIEAVVQKIDRRLFGNHQPGEMDKLRADVEGLREWRAKAKGAFWLAGIVFSAVEIGAAVWLHAKL